MMWRTAAMMVLGAGSWAAAQAPGEKADVTLSSGDVIRGTVVSDDGKTIVLDHPVLGKLTLARGDVKLAPVAIAAPPPPPPPPAPAPPPPDPESIWKGWKSSVELGLTGSDGNSQALTFHTAFNAVRDTSKTTTTFNIHYAYSSTDGDKTVDQGEASLRNDWKIGGPWRIFAIGKGEYDQFQDWDWRASAFGGFGYELIKNDNTLLLGRLGAGASKEFGSEKQRIEPELDIGLDWEQKIDERSKFFVNLDYYPSLHRFTDYRAEAKAGYEIVVDPTHNLSLKLGVDDKYQSNPGDDKKRNDILYFAALVYNF